MPSLARERMLLDSRRMTAPPPPPAGRPTSPPSGATPGAPRASSFAVEPYVLEAVLKPYKPHCRYVRSATVELPPRRARADETRDPVLSLHCTLGIPESCYIDDTGHFNSVEFNICFNQMYYLGTAAGAVYKLVPALQAMSFEEFLRRQLPDALIHEFHSKFDKPMQSRAFEGRIAFQSLVERRGFLYFKMTAAYWDAQGGHCEGAVTMVMVDGAGRGKTGAAG